MNSDDSDSINKIRVADTPLCCYYYFPAQVSLLAFEISTPEAGAKQPGMLDMRPFPSHSQSFYFASKFTSLNLAQTHFFPSPPCLAIIGVVITKALSSQ